VTSCGSKVGFQVRAVACSAGGECSANTKPLEQRSCLVKDPLTGCAEGKLLHYINLHFWTSRLRFIRLYASCKCREWTRMDFANITFLQATWKILNKLPKFLVICTSCLNK